MNMEEFIQDFVEKNNYNYCKIENQESIKLIYNLYYHGINGREKSEIEDSEIDLYYGVYYRIKKDYGQMKKYYLMAIEKGNKASMNNLGHYYRCIEKNYKQAEKYYLMAIENNSSIAMANLGYYYQYVEKDYKQMKKYYLMAIENNHCGAMNNLGYYYQNIKKKYRRVKKYYLMAIENNHYIAMYNLGFHYQHVEKDYNLMKKYYLMAIDKGHMSAIFNLEKFYIDNNDTLGLLQLYIKIGDKAKISNLLINYFNQTNINQEINLILLQYFDCIDVTNLPISFKLFKQLLNNQIDLLEVHFKYSENGSGYQEAKQDFLKQLSS